MAKRLTAAQAAKLSKAPPPGFGTGVGVDTTAIRPGPNKKPAPTTAQSLESIAKAQGFGTTPAPAAPSGGPSLQAIWDAFHPNDVGGNQTDSTQLPVDPVYAGTVGNNNQTEADNDLGYVNTRNTGLTNLGYTATYDPNDPWALASGSSLTYDPNNPFSQATLLRQHYQQAQNAATNSLAAQGQLYSGAEGNAQGYATDNFNQGDNSLLTQAQGLVATAVQNHRTNVDATGAANLTALGTSVANQQPSATPASPASPSLADIANAFGSPGAAVAFSKTKNPTTKASKPVVKAPTGKAVGKPKAVGFTKFK